MTKDAFAARLKHACASVAAAEPELTEIDSRFGDADHGLTMAKIAGAISAAAERPENGIQAMLDGAATAVMTSLPLLWSCCPRAMAAGTVITASLTLSPR